MASPKPKRKPAPKPKTDKEQSERFKAMARLLRADPTGAGFERALGKIVPPKRKLRGSDKTGKGS